MEFSDFAPASSLVQKETVSQQQLRAFRKYASEVGERVLRQSSVVLVHHFDADGLSAAGICHRALTEKKVLFRTVALKKMDPNAIRTLSEAPEPCLLICDLSAGFLKDLARIALAPKMVAILDHHPPEEDALPDSLHLVNPHRFGMDGAHDACSASTAFFAFSAHVPVAAAKHMAQSALVGAVGDVQDREGLVGANRLLLQQAQKLGVVRVENDLRIFGRVSRGLVSFISFCSEPLLPGLSGSDKQSALFLFRHGIPFVESRNGERRWLRYNDLSHEQRFTLRGALIAYGAGRGVPEKELKSLLGPVYLFPDEDSASELFDAYEFSTLLNACGRHDRPDLGVALASGNRSVFEEAKRMLRQHRLAIRKGISFARRHAEDMGAFYFLDARSHIPDSVIGTVAGAFFNSGAVKQVKPVIAFSMDDNGLVKVSSRASKPLIEKGIHLGRVMQNASLKVNGYGGGHSIAAGASFSSSAENESAFLLACQQIIASQLRSDPVHA